MLLKYKIGKDWNLIKEYCTEGRVEMTLIDFNDYTHSLVFIEGSGFYLDYYWKGYCFDDIEKFLSLYFKGFLAIG